MSNPSKLISSILKHDAKRNSYKIALVRAINDVALEYPHLVQVASGVAIPLRLLAEFWLAYYWAFVDPQNPIRQGHDSTDMVFRSELTSLRILWQSGYGADSPAEGFFIKNMMTLPRKRDSYPQELYQAYERCLSVVIKALQQPIRYAGTGEYKLFQKPQKLKDLSDVVTIPTAKANDLCLFVPMSLWQVFQELSLWIEALCIHEWALFTESVQQTERIAQRGLVYALLTMRPDNRRPLSWERNQIDLLLMEGYVFTCPWTQKNIRSGTAYDLDHIVPIAIRPINEMWNLVPADPQFNSHTKRDRLPSSIKLVTAQPVLQETYNYYLASPSLRKILETEAQMRFGLLSTSDFSSQLVAKAVEFVLSIAELRHVAQF